MFCSLSSVGLSFVVVSFAAASLSAAAEPAVAGANAGLGGNLPGKTVYDQHCSACHGPEGDGKGPASVWLFPRPRNFSAGMFKIKSTPGTSLPTDADLLNAVTRGMPGSSMPSFTYLSEQERRDVVQYVKSLTSYVNAGGQRINRFDEARQSGTLAGPIEVPPEPPVTVQSLARGAQLFNKLQCIMCHGETGAGDGPNASSLKDTQGLYLPPRDFNTGAFRGGHTGRDLFTRIAIGLAGTPMVAFDNKVMTDDERWSLVHFVQSLRRRDVEINDFLAPTDGLIHAPRVRGKLPLDPVDPAWENMDPGRVVLNPLWPETNIIYAVAVRAIHDGKRVAIHCTWRDPIADGAPVRIHDFQDGLALQFSLNGNTPFLGMGDANNPVNLWHWKAGWQEEMDGQRQDVTQQYPAMHVDTYFGTSYRTAVDAGNQISTGHKSPVENATARGFGTLRSRPTNAQNVSGKGVWRDGSWSVMFVRDLKSKDPEDVKFELNRPVPIAFAVWNGQNRDRNGRKVISNWHKLILEP